MRIAVGNLQQRFDAWSAFPRANPAQTLPGQNTVIGVQRDNVRNRPQRDQIEIFRQIRHRDTARLKPAFITQQRAQRQYQIESDPYPRERFRREVAVAQIGVNDRFGSRQGVTWQMVIGDDNRDPKLMRPIDPGV
ncbi:hypothetical protein D3C80_1565100 [compost metagenome]